MTDEASPRVENHAEEDENYFVSMTDMMVGVLFVFIILLMVFALNFRQQTDVSEDKIKRLQEAAMTAAHVRLELDQLQRRVNQEVGLIAAANSVRTELLTTLKTRLKEAGLEVTIDAQNGVLRLGENAINFGSDKATLDAAALDRVDRLAGVLATVLPLYSVGAGDRAAFVETVFVEGHTDSMGTPQHNWELSTQRAVNTFWRLVEKQPSLLQLHNRAGTEILSVAGYSFTRPVPDVALNALALHRRIDLRFVMDEDNRDRLSEVLEVTEQMQLRLDDLRTAIEEANAPSP